MAVAYANQGAANLVLSSSITLAKPSGLAVGDLMIALLAAPSGSGKRAKSVRTQP